MKITNRFNLPSGFVNLASEQRAVVPKVYSVTTIMGPTRKILLERRHHDEIETDVADMINLIFGTAVHHILEMHDKENMLEKRMNYEIRDGYMLSGQFDLYNKETATIEDYKTCKVWTINNDDFSSWKKQGLMYAWLARKHGLIVEHLRFHAIIKDWSAGNLKYKKNYPPHPIWTWEHHITTADILDIEVWIRKRFDEIIFYENQSELPMCSEEERWGDKLCQDYCNAKNFCSYGKKLYGGIK